MLWTRAVILMNWWDSARHTEEFRSNSPASKSLLALVSLVVLLIKKLMVSLFIRIGYELKTIIFDSVRMYHVKELKFYFHFFL